MGYGDGYYYGQGKFICNTANLLQGDVIRVRSLTDTSKVWNKTVTSTDTPIIFDVPGKDYYRICLVQDIDGTPTEIGGTNYPIHYGYVQYVDVLDKTTLGGIQGILNAHQEGELLAIGDEVTITVSGSPWTMQIGAIDLYNSHEVIFVSKNLWTLSAPYQDYGSLTNGLRPIMQSFYSNIIENDRQYIKSVTRKYRIGNGSISSCSDYVWTVGMTEVSSTQVSGTDQSVFPIFVTQVNRVRTYNGTQNAWYSDDAYSSSNSFFIPANGSISGNNWSGDSKGVLPCFTLQADS